MGITAYTAENLAMIIKTKKVKSVVELGSQNLYIEQPVDKPPFADDWYRSLGVERYVCIDLAGDNNAIRWDLSQEREFPDQYDLVTDIGTSEHIVQMNEYETVAFHDDHIHSVYPKGEVGDKRLGFYNAWLNKHKLCHIGGIIYSENPKTEHWPDHGYSYITPEFYVKLMSMSGYTIHSSILEEHAAMGNHATGVNVVCALFKYKNKFPSFEEFSTLPIFDK
jgi:hypothetical protein